MPSCFGQIKFLLQNECDYGRHNSCLPALVSSHTLPHHVGMQKHVWRTLSNVNCGIKHIKREAEMSAAAVLCAKLVRKFINAAHPPILLGA